MSSRVWLAAACTCLAAASIGAGSSPTPLPLSKRMLRAGDLVGFTPNPPSFVSDPAKWAHSCPSGEADRLRRSGFVAAASLHLSSEQSGRDAISFVARFRTAAAARADVRTFVSNHPHCTSAEKLATFAVPAIPGSHGFVASRSDGQGYDVLFADGVFSYDVGAFTVDRKGPPTETDVAAAAKRLYRRVHGHPAP